MSRALALVAVSAHMKVMSIKEQKVFMNQIFPSKNYSSFSEQQSSIKYALSLAKVNLSLKSTAGQVEILKDVSLSVYQGQSVAIVGPSGSGKTSLLMVASGLERATSGTIEAAGTDITSLNDDELATFRRKHIGIVFQQFHLMPTMTALENAALPLELAGDKQANTKAKAALDAVGMSHRLTHYPSQLSGGEQQRVAIARAFATEPPVLLADEPTGNLDEDTGKQVIELLFTLQEKQGSTLLLITHDAALAAQCDRTVRMHGGMVEE
jgi:putative ABC transport system ATP-binding protein